MPSRPRRPSTLRSGARAAALVAALALGLPRQAAAVTNGPSPFVPQPAALWGELRPAAPDALPPERDQTDFNEFKKPYQSAGLLTGAQLANGLLYTSTNWGMQLWDIAADPASPKKIGFFSWDGFLQKAVGEDAKLPVLDVAAPEAGAPVALLACTGGMGMAAVSTAGTQGKTILLYQDAPAEGSTSFGDVYAARIGDKSYGFYADPQRGLRVYDLDAIAKLQAQVLEDAPAASTAAPGVYLGQPFQALASYARVAGVGPYLIAGSLSGFALWDVSSPASPVLRASESDPKASKAVGAVAMWRQGPATYAAVCASMTRSIALYDVTDVVVGKAPLGAPVGSFELPGFQQCSPYGYLTASHAGNGAPFLHYGMGGTSSSPDLTVTLEWLLDVSDPAKPRDVTPPPAMVGDKPAGYWGWGYQFGWVFSHRALLNGNLVYHVAGSILDVHVWTPPASAGAGGGAGAAGAQGGGAQGGGAQGGGAQGGGGGAGGASAGAAGASGAGVAGGAAGQGGGAQGGGKSGAGLPGSSGQGGASGPGANGGGGGHSDDGGCGCRLPGGPPAAGPGWVSLLVLAVVRRRPHGRRGRDAVAKREIALAHILHEASGASLAAS